MVYININTLIINYDDLHTNLKLCLRFSSTDNYKSITVIWPFTIKETILNNQIPQDSMFSLNLC